MEATPTEAAEKASSIVQSDGASSSVQEAIALTRIAVGQKRKRSKEGYSSTASLVFIESDDELEENHTSSDNKGI